LTRSHNDVSGQLFITGSDNQASGNGTAEKTGTTGIASGANGDKYGVWGAASGTGGINTGVFGTATGDFSAYGGFFQATGLQTVGVYGVADGASSSGVYGFGLNGGKAGSFQGDVGVTGTLTKGGGAFRIDHPLDPENKYLQHSFVESPDMKNIYDGIVTLDANGAAIVTLPDWFGALNQEFRYQLTCVGGYAPVYISSEVSDNRFSIAGGTPGLKVSWQLTGVRKDVYAEAHRIQVEVDKNPAERGKYLHPLLFGESEEQGIAHKGRGANRSHVRSDRGSEAEMLSQHESQRK
jgi:hypothetical protein